MHLSRYSINSRLFLLALIATGSFFTTPIFANPTGGAVVSGSATIQGGSGTTTINQTSRGAIINWQTFSINVGENTHFIQPNAQSAALNRVLGGSSSQINGTLSANGQVYLINQNGILVGPGGVINAAGGFTGSTRDITDSDFLKGNLHFMGHSHGEIRNLGQIKSELGNVTLVGRTVGNRGSIDASRGTVGLVAGDDVLLGQKNADGSTITVNASPLAKQALGKTGVTNRGKISSAAAELKAANGNIYALAINNSGAIRSTTVNKQGGHIWLTADSGTILNSGALLANATAPGGHGGNIVLKSTAGTVDDPGSIIAEGGLGGTGGNVDVSAPRLKFGGTVNLSAPGGKKGNLLLDPSYLQVILGGTGYISGGENDTSDSTIDPNTVDAALAGANVILNADYGITITDGISWNSPATLTLSTNYSGSSVQINSPISGPPGSSLYLSTGGSSDAITTTSNGTISVGNFILGSGFWNQNGGLPNFTVYNNFELAGGTFLRVAGGDGSQGNPFQITDVYGLQGIGSPSNNLNSDNYVQVNNINATPTGSWNVGEGFLPINFNGNYEGEQNQINGLTVNSAVSGAGLFSTIGSASVVSDVNLTNVNISGGQQVGAVAGTNNGVIANCTVSGLVSGNFEVGGLVGLMADGSLITKCSSQASVNGTGTYIGGLVGFNGNSSGGTVQFSSASGNINAPGANYVGGLIGENLGTVQNSSSSNNVNGNQVVGGLIGDNGNGGNGTVQYCYSTANVSGSTDVGGFIGYNFGTVHTCYSAGSVTGSSPVGGFIGNDSMGTINDCYYANDSSGQSVGVGAQVGTSISYAGTPAMDVTGLAYGQMTRSKNFDAAWDFTPGTGIWGINGVGQSGPINGGLPFLQSDYFVIASFTPMNQTTVYNQTNMGTGFSQNAYTVAYASGFQNTPLNGAPVIMAAGNNVNAGTSNPLFLNAPSPSMQGYAVESLSGGSETITQKPITVSAISGITTSYGKTPAFANDGGGPQLLPGDVLGGMTTYSQTDLTSAGGYLNAGMYFYIPQITGYNPNYVITGYKPGTFMITPAVLNYVADPQQTGASLPFPVFSGTVTGFLPGDNLGNSTTGTLFFGTTAMLNGMAGTFAINGGGLTSGNYTFVQAPGNATAFYLFPTGLFLPPGAAPGSPVLPPGVTPMAFLQALLKGAGAVNQLLVSAEEAAGPAGGPLGGPLGGPGAGPAGGGFLGGPGMGGPGMNGPGGPDPDNGPGGPGGDGNGGLGGANSISGVVGGDGPGPGDNGGRGGREGGRMAGDHRGGDQRGDARGGDDRNGQVVDQHGHPAAGFYTRGGFNGFSHGPVPAFVQSRLTTGLTREVRDELYDANKFSALAKADHDHAESVRNGNDNIAIPGTHAVIGTVTDQHGQPARGFYAPPGGFFGFGGATLPPMIQEHISKVLGADVRDELLNATK